MTRFVVDLGDVKLSKEAEHSLNSAIQEIAIKHISASRFEKPFQVWFPPHWYGIIIRPDFDDLRGLSKEIENFAR